jgi:alcohol dehydrogenase
VKAVVIEAFGAPPVVRDVPDPTPPADGVVVRVERTGICRSDWHAWQGHDPDVRLPHVPGHELSGEVVAIGADVASLRPGDRVTVPFVSGCFRCPTCLRGDPQVCDAQFQPGFTHWGSFAEYVSLHHADGNVVTLPEGFSHAAAASLGCRFTTAYRALVQLAELRAGQTVVIFGCGGVGLSAVLIARALGARAIAVDIDEAKLGLARELGAELGILAGADARVADRVVEHTSGGADVSLDALGSAQTLAQSLTCLRKRGRHVQVGLLIGEASDPSVSMNRIVANELSIFGSHGIAARAYPDVFELIATRGVPLERMIGETIPLSAVPERLAQMTGFGGVGIALVSPALDRFRLGASA